MNTEKIEKVAAAILTIVTIGVIITFGITTLRELSNIKEEGVICENNCIESGYEPYELSGGLFSATVCKCKEDNMIKTIGNKTQIIRFVNV